MKKLEKIKPPLLKQNFLSKASQKDIIHQSITGLEKLVNLQVTSKHNTHSSNRRSTQKLMKIKERLRSGSRSVNKNDLVLGIEKVHKH